MPSALESTCLSILYFRMCLTAAAAAAAAVVHEYASTETGAPSALLLVFRSEPRHPTVVWPGRDAPPADRASGAKQRRYTAV